MPPEEHALTYRDLVEYVAREMAEATSSRAESLMFIGRELEKMEARLQNMNNAQVAHDTWHRDVLQGLIDREPARNTSVGSLIVAVLSLLASIVIVIVTQVH